MNGTYTNDLKLANHLLYKLVSISLFVFSVFSFFIFPFLSLIIFSLSIFVYFPRHSPWVVFLVLLSFFSSINIHKELISDYAWYYAHYKFWSDGDFLYLFENSLNGVYARYTEPLYHTLSFLLAKLFGSKLAYDIFFTFLIYFLPVYGLFILKGKYKINNRILYLLIISLMVVCINPVLVLHLIRQNIGGGMLLVSIAFHLVGRTKLALLFSFLALTTHSSMIFPLMVIHPLIYYRNLFFYKYRYFIYLIFPCSIGFVLPEYITSNGIYDVLRKSDGVISPIVYAYDIILFLFAFLLTLITSNKNSQLLLRLCFSYYVFTCFTYSSDLLILRFYHLYDYIRILVYISIFLSLLHFNRITIRLFSFFLVIFGVFYSHLRFENSAFDFGGSFLYYLFISMF